MMSDASEMLAAALEQMDGIIAGSKAMNYSNGLFDCQSPTSPFLGGFRVLHLLEDLRAALELMDNEERDNLRCQIPDSTAEGVAEWLHGRLNNSVYQERLSRLESDKECLILQVSVLSDQVEVQGEKIRDLDKCLEHHREQLSSTEELLQKELLTRSSLETQKLELMTEVSSLKLKLSTVEREHRDKQVEPRTPLSLCVWTNRYSSKVQICSNFKYLYFHVCLQANSNKGPAPSSQTKTNNSEQIFGTKKIRASFGRGFFKLRSKQGASSPNHTEAEHLDLAAAASSSHSSPESRKKSKGFRKFLGRLKRSHSTSFNPDDAADAEFRRGGVRATAGPRLGWSRESKKSAVDVPFGRWSSEDVCAWLHEQGLGVYVSEGRRWVRSGQTLLQATSHDLEKELSMKQPLHRKKLQLALRAATSDQDDLRGKLDHSWVTSEVAGRHRTPEDLLSLKVCSVLHHLSIKRAVQVLRLNNYDPGCLRRRPSDENNASPAEISQWTNHRVMEWLRSVDLAEYAPNLRGSGVHGGLMVLEPRFTVEALALLLNIPPNKTLLRRHLATHFHLLVGSEAQRLKQDCVENPDYSVLTATARVKVFQTASYLTHMMVVHH
uniref:Liprin-beta-1-like n=1 Tax=Gouania willdenowi TaxID=441366 RepID=A0A8C5FZ25_GOUWI